MTPRAPRPGKRNGQFAPPKMVAAEIQTVNYLVDSCENGVVTSSVEPNASPLYRDRAHHSGFAITVPDEDREEWFSLGENHEKLRGFGLDQLRNRCRPTELL
jgi:hypothetical protein